MKHWTKQRKGEFWAHTVLFGIPFVISLVASCWFWTQHSGNVWAGIAAVVVIEVIVFGVFVLHLVGIHTTIAPFRHALPVLSSVGMFEAFYRIFAPHNTYAVAVGIAGGLSALLMVYLFFTKRGIEKAVNEQAITPEGRVIQYLHNVQTDYTIEMINSLTTPQPSYLLPRQASYPAPVAVHETPATVDLTEPSRTYTCKHCGQGGLTANENMIHGRQYKRYGQCTRPGVDEC